jgi:hypothetical protein
VKDGDFSNLPQLITAAASLGRYRFSSAVQAHLVPGSTTATTFDELAAAYAGDAQHPEYRLLLPDGGTLQLPGRGHDRSHDGSADQFRQTAGRWMLVTQQPTAGFELQRKNSQRVRQNVTSGRSVILGRRQPAFVTEHALRMQKSLTSGVIGV